MEDCKEHDILVVTTTVASLQDGQRLARLVLERRLAACVQVEQGVASIYRWEGQVCDAPEVRLVIKTQGACLAGLQALFATEHPYQLPQFVATRAMASAGYAKWVRDEAPGPP